jgi:hypothetical protein
MKKKDMNAGMRIRPHGAVSVSGVRPPSMPASLSLHRPMSFIGLVYLDKDTRLARKITPRAGTDVQ